MQHKLFHLRYLTDLRPRSKRYFVVSNKAYEPKLWPSLRGLKNIWQLSFSGLMMGPAAWSPTWAHPRPHPFRLFFSALSIACIHCKFCLRKGEEEEEIHCVCTTNGLCQRICLHVWASETLGNTKAQTDFWSLCHMRECMAPWASSKSCACSCRRS